MGAKFLKAGKQIFMENLMVVDIPQARGLAALADIIAPKLISW